MLSKLLKYEIKATARAFLPLYVVLLAFAVIQKVISLLNANNWDAPQIISMALYMTIMVGIFVMTLVVMIQRLYKNLLSDEGYLMFTLPTKPWKHITSKLLVSMMWTAASGVVAIISIIIIACDEIFKGDFVQEVVGAIGKFFEYFGATSILFIVEILLAIIIGLASSVLIIYASIALGHLFNRHRVLASLGAFLVLNTVSQIIFTIVSIIPGTKFLPEHLSSTSDFHAMEASFHLIMWYGIVFFAILAACYFIVTNYILSKRLNLE